MQKSRIIPRLYNATENLVNQQFYIDGKDTIMGRTPEIQIKVKYSGQIIAKFKDLFKENINLFLNQDYDLFMEKFEVISGLTKSLVRNTYEEFKEKHHLLEGNLGDSNDRLLVLYTILMSVLISKIRKIHFEDDLKTIRRRLKRKYPSFREKSIDRELTRLFERNDSNVSILYNLSYLYALANTFNYNKVKRVCGIQKSKYINILAKKIIKCLK